MTIMPQTFKYIDLLQYKISKNRIINYLKIIEYSLPVSKMLKGNFIKMFIFVTSGAFLLLMGRYVDNKFLIHALFPCNKLL